MKLQINRRKALIQIGTGLLLNTHPSHAAQGFWARKDISQWTSDEILQIATRSPWAVRARVLPKPGRDKGSTRGIEPAPTPGRSGTRETGSIPVVAVDEVTVVWASARPLMEVLKTHFPPDFVNHYVISISDLPPSPGTTAALETKGRESLGAGLVDNTRSRSFFGFSKELLPLTLADREAIVSISADRYSIRARFDLKEMMYRGELAL
jgi:hypothetical protein